LVGSGLSALGLTNRYYTAELVTVMEFEETRFANGMWRIAPKGIEKPRSLDAPEKIALDKKQKLLTEKAEVREEMCWCYECPRKATTWVREVGFDFKGDKAAPVDHIAISSADYVGPVPGFCTFCLGYGPKELSETVYFSRPEMYWGVRPNRWFVSFTDGTRQGGFCVEIDPKQEMPTILEEFISGS
jgi:hypothetical protein